MGRLAVRFGADAVIACGLDALPLLASVEDAERIWFANEPVGSTRPC
jgi:hypothetical protein